MQIDHLIRFKAWFDAYTRSFLTGVTTTDSPLVLKIDHTARVCENIRQLGRSIQLTANRMRIAETIGLFHDVGRFIQYTRYQTFNDLKSVNHGELGIEVINETGILDDLPADEQTMIIDAVRFHNARVLPLNPPPASTVFMQLIRDADKLDIWKVVADYFRYDQRPEPGVFHHLPDRPVWEDNIVKTVIEKRTANVQDMRSLNDFKLLQLSWVFDLYFPETFRQAERRGDLMTIARSLPDHRDLRHAIAGVMNQLQKMT